MFGSKVRATCSITPHDDVVAIALTPSSYQTLRAPMRCIASVNASSASSPAHTQLRREARRAPTTSDDGELGIRVGCTAWNATPAADECLRGLGARSLRR